MSPMLNSQYFQPMQHKPLADIRKYALLSEQPMEFYALVKPAGLDVYVNKGVMYDFNHNEIQNQYLKFHFEQLLKATINLQMTVVGVLTSTNGGEAVLKYRTTLYNKTQSTFENATFVVYDAVFPVFNDDHIYKWRYDIASKVVGPLPNCRVASKEIITDTAEIDAFVKELFTIDTSAEVLLYKSEGRFVPGISQLCFENCDVASYSVAAQQRYRAHIKKVVSETYRTANEDKFEVANHIVARFKKEYVDIPLNNCPLVLKRYIWDHRKELRDFPFWFTGYMVYDEDKYILLINNFSSFITTW